MTRKRDKISLWKDSSLPDGLELLRATFFNYRYPAHFHEEFVIAAFARGAQRHRIGGREGIAAAGSILIIAPRRGPDRRGGGTGSRMGILRLLSLGPLSGSHRRRRSGRDRASRFRH